MHHLLWSRTRGGGSRDGLTTAAFTRGSQLPWKEEYFSAKTVSEISLKGEEVLQAHKTPVVPCNKCVSFAHVAVCDLWLAGTYIYCEGC